MIFLFLDRLPEVGGVRRNSCLETTYFAQRSLEDDIWLAVDVFGAGKWRAWKRTCLASSLTLRAQESSWGTVADTEWRRHQNVNLTVCFSESTSRSWVTTWRERRSVTTIANASFSFRSRTWRLTTNWKKQTTTSSKSATSWSWWVTLFESDVFVNLW